MGAGPSGLAVARELEHRHGISTLVVEKAAAPAVSWRTRYDNFRLNTNGFLSHLPGQRIPLTAGRWPTKEDMVRYFDSYVRRQNITVALGCEVAGIDRAPKGWQIETSSGDLYPSAVVLATGRYRTPVVPPWPGLSRFTGEVLHSGDFRNGWPFQGRNVLVVGAGNSAADIAVQLADNRAGQVWLAVRTPPHLVRRAIGPIPSDLFLELFARVPARVVDPVVARLNHFLLGDLSSYGFHQPPLGLKATVEKRGRIPTLADELVAAVRAGRVKVVSAVTAVEPDRRDARRRFRGRTGGDHRRHRFQHRPGRPSRPSRRPRRTRRPAGRLRLASRPRDVRDRLRHPTQRPAACDPRRLDPCQRSGDPPERIGPAQQRFDGGEVQSMTAPVRNGLR